MNKPAFRPTFRLWEDVCAACGQEPYAIRCEDDAVLVCTKAAGVPVQSRDVRTPDLESMLRCHLAQANEKGAPSPYLGVVHRLDQPVRGLLVFAKTKAAAAALSKQAQDGTMRKEYLAVCAGVPKEQAATCSDWLVKDGRTNRARIVSEGTAGAKRAVLDYEVLAEADGFSLLHIALHTGRYHQIRAQLSHMGCPIVGDRKYGAEDDGEALMLCAYRLSFVHPKTKKRMRFALSEGARSEERKAR